MFHYGNYDGLSNPPTFDIQFDGNKWTTVTTSLTDTTFHEVVYTSKGNISVCLARTQDNQFPFISMLKVWAMPDDAYDIMTKDKAWVKAYRYNYGGSDLILVDGLAVLINSFEQLKGWSGDHVSQVILYGNGWVEQAASATRQGHCNKPVRQQSFWSSPRFPWKPAQSKIAHRWEPKSPSTKEKEFGSYSCLAVGIQICLLVVIAVIYSLLLKEKATTIQPRAATEVEMGGTTQDENPSLTVITEAIVKPSNSMENITS
ncbi:hypothetical protein GH714_003735 [Hevea brasiliensis]|uniref:Malectin-like domain-containing protein n=1 Tax=Hevea brasiliensis TaxID=3981 RepID=A0A6A6K545_HEVBR|nr:hypothetical protein GH714_003735 [Hevea brasiliensis]